MIFSAPSFSLVKDGHLPLQYRQRIRSFQEGLLIGALQSSLLVCDCPVKSVLDKLTMPSLLFLWVELVEIDILTKLELDYSSSIILVWSFDVITLKYYLFIFVVFQNTCYKFSLFLIAVPVSFTSVSSFFFVEHK